MRHGQKEKVEKERDMFEGRKMNSEKEDRKERKRRR
jgi:hypothetical protein